MLKIRYRHEAAVGSEMFAIEYVQFEFHYNNIQPSFFVVAWKLNTFTLLNIGKAYRGVCRRIAYQILLFSHFLLYNFMWHGKSVSSVDIKCSSYFLTIDKSCQMAMYVLRFLFTIRPYKINQIIKEINFFYPPKYLLRQILSQ